MNTPKYTRAEMLKVVANIAKVKLTVGIPQSYLNAIESQGEYAKAILSCAGPCMPTSISIATGQRLDKVVDKMNAAYDERGSVLDGTILNYRDLERIPEVMRAAVRGRANCDFIRVPIFENRTLTNLMKSGRTFVAIVGGGGHAVAVKGGKLYCTAGKTGRQRASYVYEVV